MQPPKENKRISKHFTAKEFGYVAPHPDLLNLLDGIRDELGVPVRISDAAREFAQHVAIYKDLEKRRLIKTKGNGLGTKELFDVIPWGSKHLPTYETPFLRASDIVADGRSGETIAEAAKRVAKKLGLHIGLGIGMAFCHVDVMREATAVWVYDY